MGFFDNNSLTTRMKTERISFSNRPGVVAACGAVPLGGADISLPAVQVTCWVTAVSEGLVFVIGWPYCTAELPYKGPTAGPSLGSPRCASGFWACHGAFSVYPLTCTDPWLGEFWCVSLPINSTARLLGSSRRHKQTFTDTLKYNTVTVYTAAENRKRRLQSHWVKLSGAI